MSSNNSSHATKVRFDPRNVIWFNDVPKEGFWKLNPNKDRRDEYKDENGQPMLNPYNEKGKVFNNGEYYEYLWTRGLPIGNGRLGTMVMGAIDKEVLQINECTVWTGAPYVDENNQPTSGTTKEAWKEYRGQHADGSPAEIGTIPDSISYRALHIDNAATTEAVQHRYNIKKQVEQNFLGTPSRQYSYQSFVEVHLDFGHEIEEVRNYTRHLDLDKGLVAVEYEHKGTYFKRESLASHPNQVIATHVSASEKGSLNFSAELRTFHVEDAKWRRISDNQIALTSKPQGDGNAIQFEARLWINTLYGEITISDDHRSIIISSADQATIFIVGATNYVNYLTLDNDKPSQDCDRYIASIQNKSFESIKAAHVSDHAELYDRTFLKINNTASTSFGNVPTDQRLRPAGFLTGGENLSGSTYCSQGDNDLAVLEFNFGKYLLISGSRPGGQPLTLQGLWNSTNSPAWSSKYTVNINTEMNYWPVQILNLHECELTLINALEDLFHSGQITAREHYAIEGDGAWIMHHNFDLWRGTQPIDNATAGLWPTSGIWLVYHAWQAYLYTLDKKLLSTCYPYMKGLAHFFNQFLVKDPETGFLITSASVSPEHGDVQPGPAMDTQLIRFLYRGMLQTADILDKTEEDAQLLATSKEKLAQVAPNLVDENGYIKEWVRGDVAFSLSLDTSDPPEFIVVDPITNERIHLKRHCASNDTDHKHASHLWELYPGDSLSLYNQSEEQQKNINGFRKGVIARGLKKQQGWALAWRINLRARLADAAGANILLKHLLASRTSPNMFDQHPPFQIDGNFGVTAGIAEMLLQSHDGVLTLLPALPKEWPSGEFKGFKARGNIVVDVKWENGIPVETKVTANHGGMVKVRSPHSSTAVVRQGEEIFPVTKEENNTVLVVDMEAGETYTITRFS
ncbi:glycoside hydrolase family 95 protein [Paenibacillus sp. FSL W7-1287]|uniref:glycoside hydrolase family 95 protein n=1 Tax=Paenibacillus sp. FSL W7-1287 TaxID=2954538 RepID=UPI0030FCDEB6